MADKASAPTPAPASAATDPQDPNVLLEIARLGAQRKKWKDAADNLTTERDAAKAENEQLKARLAEMETKHREAAHRTRFNELAKEAGANPKALDDLYEKSGYKAEGDTPDDAKITGAIEAQKVARDWLFGGQQQQEQPLIKPGVGRGKGSDSPTRNDESKFEVTDAQLRDPAWCFQHQDQLRAAASRVINLPNAQVGEGFSIVR